MTAEEKYFVSLISSFLNSRKPEKPKGIDWNEIYRLSEIHNVSAIVANQTGRLSDEEKPDKNLYSIFRQQIGYTIMNYDEKMKAYDELRQLLTDNDIDYIFVKGIILNKFYPVKEFRTSGDIDVIIRDDDFEKFKKIVIEKGLKDSDDSTVCACFNIGNIFIEAHSSIHCDHEYFKNIFEIAEKGDDRNEYVLSLENHLLYVLCHIVNHFRKYGAGIRMFMDVDVILRQINGSLDYKKFFSLCRELNIESFVKYTFSLCRNWFNTPVKIDFDISENKAVKDMFEKEILSGGSFGYERRSLSDYYVSMAVGQNEKNGFKSKVKAFFHLLFPKKEYLYEGAPYASRHHILLPIAWLHRLYKGIFVRGGHSVSTVKGIINSDEEIVEYKKLLKELDI
ncbi:MAG: nucleotidyltransferase family protein [Eubacteriales bacterium]|nr:nucleotidyltransferase family protein [Eubacteriales bacterium]